MARGSLWTNDEVSALIAVWGEEEIQHQLEGVKRNIKVYQKIAARLKENYRYERTGVQCREKIKKLE